MHMSIIAKTYILAATGGHPMAADEFDVRVCTVEGMAVMGLVAGCGS